MSEKSCRRASPRGLLVRGGQQRLDIAMCARPIEEGLQPIPRACTQRYWLSSGPHAPSSLSFAAVPCTWGCTPCTCSPLLAPFSGDNFALAPPTLAHISPAPPPALLFPWRVQAAAAWAAARALPCALPAEQRFSASAEDFSGHSSTSLLPALHNFGVAWLRSSRCTSSSTFPCRGACLGSPFPGPFPCMRSSLALPWQPALRRA